MPPGIIWCIAGSIGTNPVIVRKILQQLKAEGFVEVSRGTGKGKSKFMGVFLSVMRKFRVILLFNILKITSGYAIL